MKVQIKHLIATLVISLVAVTCASADPIKIGVIGPNSGPYAAIGHDVLTGIQLYFKKIGYEVDGRSIKLITEDAQGRPNIGLNKVQKLVEKDDVDFIMGVVSSSVAYAIRDYTVENQVPLILTVASADGLTQGQASPYVFRTGAGGSGNSHPLGQWLLDKGFKKIILVGPNYSMGYEQTGGVARVFTKGGGEVLQALYPPLGTADYAAYLTKLKLDQADALVAVFAGSDALKFVRQLNLYGVKDEIQVVAPSDLLTDSSILSQAGEAALGIIGSTVYTTAIDSPQNKAFVASYQKAFGDTPNLYVESSYDAAKAVATAIDKLDGDVSDPERVVKVLSSVSFTAPRGQFSFGKYNSPVNTVYITKVVDEDGKYVNKPIAHYSDVSQFWTWTPKQYLKMPSYHDMAEKWTSK